MKPESRLKTFRYDVFIINDEKSILCLKSKLWTLWSFQESSQNVLGQKNIIFRVSSYEGQKNKEISIITIAER